MKTTSSIMVDAAASTVWSTYTDVERWPEWTASVTSITPLDGPEVEVGHRFEIEQPRFPRLVWEVTDVEPGIGWTWRQRSPGGTTVATHFLVDLGSDATRVDQSIDQRGPVGTLVGLVARNLTRRYLDMESQGLKARVEESRRHDAPTS